MAGGAGRGLQRRDDALAVVGAEGDDRERDDRLDQHGAAEGGVEQGAEAADLDDALDHAGEQQDGERGAGERGEAADDGRQQRRALLGGEARGGAAQGEDEHGDPAQPGAHRQDVEDVRGQQDRDRATGRWCGRRARAAGRGRTSGTARISAAGLMRGRRSAWRWRRRRRRTIVFGRAASRSGRAARMAPAASQASAPRRPGAAEARADHLSDHVRLGRVPERAALADGALQRQRRERGEEAGDGGDQDQALQAGAERPRDDARGAPAGEEEDQRAEAEGDRAVLDAAGDARARCS